MNKLKIGIIGAGNIAEVHIEAYRKNPQVELYALCDVNPVRLEEMGRKYGVERCFTEASEMLALPELDAVFICSKVTPPPSAPAGPAALGGLANTSFVRNPWPPARRRPWRWPRRPENAESC